MSANNIRSVAIVGCGWYGLPLAQVLLKQGYEVRGCKQTAEGVAQLVALGIQGYPLVLETDTQEIPSALVDVDAMIINIPPRLRAGQTDYLQRLRQLKHALLANRLQKLIFISSTGVYGNGVDLDESAAIGGSEKAQILHQAEQLFLDAPELLTITGQAYVLRFAGLMGGSRHPGRFFAGKSELRGGEMSVNMVHLQDCLAATALLLGTTNGNKHSIYNLVAPLSASGTQNLPLTKKAFYQAMSAQLSLPIPEYVEDAAIEPALEDKQINGQKICQQLGFQYQLDSLEKLLIAF